MTGKPECRRIEPLLPALYDQLLSEAEAQRVASHVAGCAWCTARLAQMEHLDHALRQAPQPVAGPTLRQTLAMRIAHAQSTRTLPMITSKRKIQEAIMQTTEHDESVPVAPTPERRRSGSRVVSIISAPAATLVIIALITILFVSHTAHPRTGTPPPAPNTTPTQATPPDWNPVPGLKDFLGIPVLAPSDPRVVYAVQNNPAQFQRSDDGGATWHTMPVPDGITTILPGNASVLVSPLDARRVFLTVGICMDSAPYTCTYSSYSSRDGGAQWTRQQFPFQDASFASTPHLSAQGTRLYAFVEQALLNSEDDGATWQVINQPLIRQGVCPYDFAAAPTGSLVFALTNVACPSSRPTGSEALTFTSMNSQTLPLSSGPINPCKESFPDQQLWRSDDAGAHWNLVHTFPMHALLEGDLSVVEVGDAARPLLYTDVLTRCDHPYADPAALQVSADGGKTWQAAPTEGAPAPDYDEAVPGSYSLIMGTLSNGLVLKVFDSKFYAWKVGETRWQQVTSAPPGLILNREPDDTIWVIHDGQSGKDSLYLETNEGFEVNSIYHYVLP